MNGGKQPLGYTIIEVMIVLAVSAVMFLIATTFINGKQQRTAFTAGVNEMASQLQDIIDQVQSGKYSDFALSCTTSGRTIQVSSAVSDRQGKNLDCVYLGKIIHFSVGNDKTSYEVISVGGNRLDSKGLVASDLDDDATGAGATLINGLTTDATVPQALDVSNIANQPNSKQRLSFAIGFLQAQGSNTDASKGSVNLTNGAQTVSLYYLDSATNPNTAKLTSGNVLNHIKPASYASICINDGNRYAQIVLGNNGNQLNVHTVIDGTARRGSCLP